MRTDPLYSQTTRADPASDTGLLLVFPSHSDYRPRTTLQRSGRRMLMLARPLQGLIVSFLVSFFLAGIMAAQTTNALPSEAIAANQELDHQLLEGYRLLDAKKVMALFASSDDIFFISPDGDLHRGRDEVRQAWERFFASLISIHGEINHVSYRPAGDGVIAVGQVTYYRQVKG